MVIRARVIPCLLGLIVVAAACGDVKDDDRSRPPTPSRQLSASAHGGGVSPLRAIDLTCSSGNSASTPSGTELRGVTTGFFGWRPGSWREEDLRPLPHHIGGPEVLPSEIADLRIERCQRDDPSDSPVALDGTALCHRLGQLGEAG